MLLRWGHSYGLGEQRWPDNEELCHTAFNNIELMDRAASLKKAQFLPMVHENPLSPRFHHYEYTHLAEPEQLFPDEKPLFVRTKEGRYTFRYGPLRKGRLPMIQDCPGARAYRAGEPAYQDAIESLFEYAEERFRGVILRPGDGTFPATWPMLTLGTMLGSETVYDAWPTLDKLPFTYGQYV